MSKPELEAMEHCAQIAEELFPPDGYNKAGKLIAEAIRAEILKAKERKS
jgi:hypothetical protein